MKNFEYLEPTSIAEACALLKQNGDEAKIFAGGAHLTILMKQGLYQPRALINIKKIPGLKGIHCNDAGLSIGELLTDLSQIFIALDGRVKIAGPIGDRIVPVEELFLDFYTTILADDEIIT